MERAVGSNQSAIADERRAAEAAIAERDKLKADLDEVHGGRRRTRPRREAKHKTTLDALATAAQAGAGGAGRDRRRRAPASVGVSFPAAKLIDANGIDVSDAGHGGASRSSPRRAKKEGAKIRIRARSSAAAPPKELRSLFHTAGEMNAVRAARVMSALRARGPAARRGSRSSATSPRRARRARARGKKAAAPPAADRVELEIEPE